MSLSHRPGDGRRSERGAALAELTLVLPIMLLLLLVVFDFGQGFLAYISVTEAARDGARVSMQNGEDCAKTNTNIETAVINAASPAFPPDDWNATPADGGTCHVWVQYQYTPILPFVTSSFSLPGLGTIGPLWDGVMSETAVGQSAPAS
jgi:hypothetical protein